MVHSLVIAFQLLTRIPFPVRVERNAGNLGYSILFYPIVGAAIGALLLLLSQPSLGLPPLLQGALVLTAWVAVTGGLHLDGLADSTDGWVGGMGDRERMLEIMKDPRSGPMGVVAIVLILLLKWSAVTALIEMGHWALLLWPPVLARTLLIGLFQSTNYLRAGGMGEGLLERVPSWAAVVVQLSVFVAAALLGVHWTLLLTVVMAALLFRWVVVHQLGGITGDIAGAMVEKMETLLLLLLVIAG